MPKLRVGIVGCGGIANAHAKAIALLPDKLELVAMCDVEANRAAGFRDTYTAGKAQVFTDYKEMYAKAGLNLVYICLPPFAHDTDVEDAAAAGIHILIEKPIALSVQKAKAMVDAVRKHKVKAQVGFLMRFGTAIERAKELLAGGKPTMFLGRYLCNSLHSPWWRDKKKAGGQVVEQIIHIFDLSRYLFGEPESVFCVADNLLHKDTPGYTVEDVSGTTVRFRNGAVGVVAATNTAIPGRWLASFTVVSDKFTAEFSSANEATFTHTAHDYLPTEALRSEKNTFLAETADLLSAIETGRPNRVPMEEGLKSLELVLAARKSGETGKPVKIES